METEEQQQQNNDFTDRKNLPADGRNHNNEWESGPKNEVISQSTLSSPVGEEKLKNFDENDENVKFSDKQAVDDNTQGEARSEGNQQND